MIKDIDNPKNKERIAIIAVGYNRKKALARLLDSLNKAQYDVDGVPLVISIDASGDTDLYDYANRFDWKHGVKYVNIQQKRLGLKAHIFQCFSLTRFFKGVIILEDDILVSPFFYHYANSTLDKYGDDENVAAIAFYRNEYNGFESLPIQHISSGHDVLAIQAVCSWGEMLNERMWKNFATWMEGFDGDFSSYDMDDRIKKWDRAWSKYMYAYMLETDTYFIYPYESVTTNFNDAGGEHGGGNSVVQVSLLQGKRNYQLGDFSQLEHYDVYGQNKSLALWLGIEPKQLSVDYYGSRSHYSGRYVLAPFDLPYDRVRGFQHVMRPWELNIKYNLEGEDIILYDRGIDEPQSVPKRSFSYGFLLYYFRRYLIHVKPRFVLKLYWNKVMQKIGVQ